jgi:PAS domain S-box-containing protein
MLSSKTAHGKLKTSDAFFLVWLLERIRMSSETLGLGSVSVDEIIPTLDSLQMHSHPCSIYRTTQQLKRQFVPYLRSGLALGEKCVYFIDENDERFVLDAMQEGGFDLSLYLKTGQFEIVHTRDAHLAGGHFGEDKMLGYWNQSIESAKKAGFKGLRAAVEMTWALSGSPGCEILAPYESRLTHLMNEKDASVICMYSQRRFSAEKIKAVIHAHPLVVTGDTVLENPACPTPEDFNEGSVDLDIQATLDNLQLIRSLRKAEHELTNRIREDASFRVLVASVKDYAIFMLDPQGNILTWNDGAERIKGYKASEIIGQHFSKFYTRDAIERRHPQKELEIAIAEGRYEEEGPRLRKDGTIFWANVVITALYDGNKLIGFGKVTRDLTEKREAEQARQRALDDVIKINSELQQLAYTISHELQDPISSITSYSKLLRSRYHGRLGSDADDFLRHIEKGAFMTARMVDDLWTYARVTKPGASKVGINLSAVVERVTEQLKASIAKSGCQIRFASKEDLPTLYCNAEQIEFVIQELITNAIKHHKGPQPPSVEISARADRGGHLIFVADNGPGIDRFFAQQIFTIYRRLDGKPDETGTGMGLPICKKIIEDQHDGKLGFESFADRPGVRFFFWLPDKDSIKSGLSAAS